MAISATTALSVFWILLNCQSCTTHRFVSIFWIILHAIRREDALTVGFLDHSQSRLAITECIAGAVVFLDRVFLMPICGRFRWRVAFRHESTAPNPQSVGFFDHSQWVEMLD